MRERSESAAPPSEPAEKPRNSARPQPKRRKPSELELLEAEIAETETRVEALERKLAENWTDMDVLTAHRAARDELKGQLFRWEELFESAQSPAP
ncbi:hypothetical protein BH09ACT13_BH09ACT13_03270 [soil metagenome]